MVYGLRFKVYGLRFKVYGLWFKVYGLWFKVYGLRLKKSLANYHQNNHNYWHDFFTLIIYVLSILLLCGSSGLHPLPHFVRR